MPTAARRRKTDTSQADLLRQWRQRCRRAKTLRTDWWERWHVDELAAAFHGDLDLDNRTVNRFWPTIKAMLPGLLFQTPSWRISPSLKGAGPIPRQQGRLMEELLHAIAQQDGHFKDAASLALRQAFFSIGVLKATYDPTLERNPQAGQPLFVRDQGGLLAFDEQGAPVHALDPDTGQPAREPSHIVSDEAYRWQWVNAQNMLLPDQGPDMRRWTWIGEEITVPLDAARDDDRFPQTLRHLLRPTPRPTRPGQPLPDTPFGSGEASLDQEVTYIECYDARAKKLYIFAEGQSFSDSAWLYCGDLPDGVEEHPYALLRFEPLIDPEPSPWPIPFTYNWLSLQHEYATRRRQQMEGAKRSARKTFYEDGTFPDIDEATKALQSTEDMAAIKISDLNRPPVVVTDPGLSAAVAQDLLVLTEDWRVTTGQTGARLSRPDSDTATEALLTNQAANLRDLDTRSVVADWLATAGRKMLQRLRQTMTLERSVKIRGLTEQDLQQHIAKLYGAQGLSMAQMLPNLRESFLEQFGQEQWLRVSRDDLQHEADVTVNPVSSKAKTVDAERQQFLQFVELLAAAPYILQSRELLRLIGDYFELVSDTLIDELFALGQRMQQQHAQQAQSTPGRSGGSSSAVPAPTASGLPPPTGLMSTLMQITGGT